MADAKLLTIESFKWMGGANTRTVTSLNTTTPKVGFVFQAPRADTFTHIGLGQTNFLGTPGTNNFRVTLCSVDGSGLPSSDVGSTATLFTPTNVGQAWVWIQLGTPYTCTPGQFLAVVIEAVTPDNANLIAVSRNLLNIGRGHGIPYELTSNGSTWTKMTTVNATSTWGVKSANYVYGFPTATTPGTSTVAVDGDRAVTKFNLPTTFGSSFRVLGFRSYGVTADAGGSYKVGLWNSAGTLLQGGTSYDSDLFDTADGTQRGAEFYFTDTTLPTLKFGTDYYIGFQGVGTTSVFLSQINCTNAADLAAFPLGTNVYSSSLVQSLQSTWIDNPLARPFIDIILDDWTVNPAPLSRVFTDF